ncbi:DUF3560 domain-containing protein [Streptomyces sp. NPDC003691]
MSVGSALENGAPRNLGALAGAATRRGWGAMVERAETRDEWTLVVATPSDSRTGRYVWRAGKWVTFNTHGYRETVAFYRTDTDGAPRANTPAETPAAAANIVPDPVADAQERADAEAAEAFRVKATRAHDRVTKGHKRVVAAAERAGTAWERAVSALERAEAAEARETERAHVRVAEADALMWSHRPGSAEYLAAFGEFLTARFDAESLPGAEAAEEVREYTERARTASAYTWEGADGAEHTGAGAALETADHARKEVMIEYTTFERSTPAGRFNAETACDIICGHARDMAAAVRHAEAAAEAAEAAAEQAESWADAAEAEADAEAFAADALFTLGTADRRQVALARAYWSVSDVVADAYAEAAADGSAEEERRAAVRAAEAATAVEREAARPAERAEAERAAERVAAAEEAETHSARAAEAYEITRDLMTYTRSAWAARPVETLPEAEAAEARAFLRLLDRRSRTAHTIDCAARWDWYDGARVTDPQRARDCANRARVLADGCEAHARRVAELFAWTEHAQREAAAEEERRAAVRWAEEELARAEERARNQSGYPSAQARRIGEGNARRAVQNARCALAELNGRPFVARAEISSAGHDRSWYVVDASRGRRIIASGFGCMAEAEHDAERRNDERAAEAAEAAAAQGSALSGGFDECTTVRRQAPARTEDHSRKLDEDASSWRVAADRNARNTLALMSQPRRRPTGNADDSARVVLCWTESAYPDRWEVTASWRGHRFLVGQYKGEWVITREEMHPADARKCPRQWRKGEQVRRPDRRPILSRAEADALMAARVEERRQVEADMRARIGAAAEGPAPVWTPVRSITEPRRAPKADRTPADVLAEWGDAVTYEEIIPDTPEDSLAPAPSVEPRRPEADARCAPVVAEAAADSPAAPAENAAPAAGGDPAPVVPALPRRFDADASMALAPEITRARRRAEEAELRAVEARRRAEQLGDSASAHYGRFAGGQPILMGHHSARGALRARERGDAATRRAVEATAAAERAERDARKAAAEAERAAIVHGRDRPWERSDFRPGDVVEARKVYTDRYVVVRANLKTVTLRNVNTITDTKARYDQILSRTRDGETVTNPGAADAPAPADVPAAPPAVPATDAPAEPAADVPEWSPAPDGERWDYAAVRRVLVCKGLAEGELGERDGWQIGPDMWDVRIMRVQGSDCFRPRGAAARGSWDEALDAYRAAVEAAGMTVVRRNAHCLVVRVPVPAELRFTARARRTADLSDFTTVVEFDGFEAIGGTVTLHSAGAGAAWYEVRDHTGRTIPDPGRDRRTATATLAHAYGLPTPAEYIEEGPAAPAAPARAEEPPAPAVPAEAEPAPQRAEGELRDLVHDADRPAVPEPSAAAVPPPAEPGPEADDGPAPAAGPRPGPPPGPAPAAAGAPRRAAGAPCRRVPVARGSAAGVRGYPRRSQQPTGGHATTPATTPTTTPGGGTGGRAAGGRGPPRPPGRARPGEGALP